MTIRDLGNLVIYFGAVAGALTAIGVLARYVVVRPLKRWLAEQIETPLTQVRAEVIPNHGHSMKDQIGRVEQDVRALRTDLTEHIANHHGGQP